MYNMRACSYIEKEKNNMANEWTVNCKTCGKEFRYSARSQDKIFEKGQTRPEYCDECQRIQRRNRGFMSVSYFKTEVPGDISDLSMGHLGKINNPERSHVLKTTRVVFDESNFGIKRENVLQLHQWFQDPSHRVAIIVGGTGSGKSTALPYWLAYPPAGIEEDFFTKHGQILIGQPRQNATSSTSNYTAKLSGSKGGAGTDIGYSHGGESDTDWRNILVSKTHQQIVNMLKKGNLRNVGTIFIDEAHERSIQIDTLLRQLKDQLSLYPHLRVIIASATIRANDFIDYFGENITTKIEFDSVRKFDYQIVRQSESDSLPYEDITRLSKVLIHKTASRVIELLESISSGKNFKGDVLVFALGVKDVEEIKELVKKEIENRDLRYKTKILRLFRGVDPKESQEAIEGDEIPDTVRVIVSTDIAEASVTIKSLVYVIENGLAKSQEFDDEINNTRLQITIISKANATQRYGRSGRVREGVVYCMYTNAQYETLLSDDPAPDIQSVNMGSALLDARINGISNPFTGWITNPDTDRSNAAYADLLAVGALDEKGSVTHYGMLISKFSYPPRVVDLILLSDALGCSNEIATILPFVLSGSSRKIYNWNFDWSANTKYQAFEKHVQLERGCKDDIDLILKIYINWMYDPSMDYRQRTEAERSQWADTYFLNNALLENAEQKRIEILKSLNGRKKDSEYRPPSHLHTTKIRFLFWLLFPEDIRMANTPYWYKSYSAIKNVKQFDLVIEHMEVNSGVDPTDLISVIRHSCDLPKGDSEDILNIEDISLLDVIDSPTTDSVSPYTFLVAKLFSVFGDNPHDFDTIYVLKTNGVHHFADSKDLCTIYAPGIDLFGERRWGQMKKILSLEGQHPWYSSVPKTITFYENMWKFKKEGMAYAEAQATIVRINPDKITVLVDIKPDNQDLIFPLLHVYNEHITPGGTELSVGDKVTVTFVMNSDREVSVLINDKISKEILDRLVQLETQVRIEGEALYFKGQLSVSLYNDLSSLVISEEDAAFLLDLLKQTNNTRNVKCVVHTWVGQYLDKVFGLLLIKGRNQRGYVFEIDGIIGILPLNLSYNKSLSVGDKLYVKVADYDVHKNEFVLTGLIPHNNPSYDLKVGKSYDGVITKITDVSIFVKIDGSYSSMIWKNKVDSPSSYEVGDKVVVKVSKIDTSKMKVGLSTIHKAK